jgi:tetratricopeptide (TPR) repeat protein
LSAIGYQPKAISKQPSLKNSSTDQKIFYFTLHKQLIMKRWLLTLGVMCMAVFGFSQQNLPIVDSLKSKLAKTEGAEERFKILSKLSRILMNSDRKESDRYATQMMQEVELSRNRSLMVRALLIQGDRYSYLMTQKEMVDKAINYYNQALQLANSSKLEKEKAQSLMALSAIHLAIPELDKALNYTNQAYAVVNGLKNDSMRAVVHNSFGDVYLVKRERLLSLRNYLMALRIAEETKNGYLMRASYRNLAAFYGDIKEYDKAIDYSIKAKDKLGELSVENSPYQAIVDMNTIAGYYGAKKNPEMAIYYYEQAIRKADSLKYEPLKVLAYINILNQFITDDQPKKALDYFNTNPDLKRYIIQFGYPHVIDQAYGVIYTGLKQFDSANYYFNKAKPVFESTGTPVSKMGFYVQYASLFSKSGDYPKAIEYFTKAKELADQTSTLEWQELVSKQLDSVYSKSGNYQQAYVYNGLYHKYKDSLQKLSEEKDVMQMELQDEQERIKRKAEEEKLALDRKHQVQYMGITVAIASVFLLLVLFGIFQVSVTTIKILGFFAFIFLFEFIILLADNQIHHATHGEPLKVLAIKIVLIAMLLPLHHWLEHKVVSYLSSRRLIIPKGRGFWSNILAKRKTQAHSERPTFAQNSEV